MTLLGAALVVGAVAVLGAVLLVVIARRNVTSGRGGLSDRVLSWLQRTGRALLDPLQKPAGAVETAEYAPLGYLHVHGWVRNGAETTTVVVLVDEVPRGFGAFNNEWEEDGASGGDRAPKGRAAWSATIDLPGWRDRQVPVRAIAITEDGLWEALERVSVTLTPTPGVGVAARIDRPKPGTSVIGSVTVEGWALPPGGVSRIEMRVDGHSAGRARAFAMPRPELARRSDDPSAPLAGFWALIDVGGRTPGSRVSIDGTATGLDGSESSIAPVEVVVGDQDESDRIDWGRLAALRAQVAEECGRPPEASEPAIRSLVVTHDLGLGGGQLYLSELLRRLLSEPDFSCFVLAPTEGPLREVLEGFGAVVHVCGDYPADSPDRYESKLLELAGLVRRHGCNVAIVNTMTASFGADLAQRLGLATIWAIHESFSLEELWLTAHGPGGMHPYVRDRAVAALRGAAAVVFEADATRSLYASYGDDDRFLTIPYGVDTTDIDAYLSTRDRSDLRQAAGIPDDAVVLLCLGLYEPRKSQAALVLAFARIAREFPDAAVALVGDTGTVYAEGIHDMVTRLGLDDRVLRIPVVDDTYQWYRLSDALVSASDLESLPRSVLEAMAFGLPVLAADVYGLPELITDGVTGLLFEPRDVGVLEEALRRLLSMDPEERREIGAAGSELVRTRHDAAHYGAAYRTLLRGLVTDPQAKPVELLAR